MLDIMLLIVFLNLEIISRVARIFRSKISKKLF
jgi:hypothetical protein